MEFISQRYEYLNTIVKEIDQQFSDYINTWSNTPIPKSSDPLEQIEILISEVKQRSDNDYYKYELDVLK